MQTVMIKWFGPYNLERIHLHSISATNGFYAISRVWGDTETLLYIGRTKRSLQQRIKEHQCWLNEYRGQIKVRFGTLQSTPGQRVSQKLVADIEALLIILNETVENTANTTTCSIRPLKIINMGRRGQLDRTVSSNSKLLKNY